MTKTQEKSVEVGAFFLETLKKQKWCKVLQITQTLCVSVHVCVNMSKFGRCAGRRPVSE